MREWFARFPAGTEARGDSYLLRPRLRGLSVKLRDGIALDIKSYLGSPGILDLPRQSRGRLESWRKWSLPCGLPAQGGRYTCRLGHRPQKTPQLLVPAGRDPGPGLVPAVSRPDGLRGGAYRGQCSRRVVVVGGIRSDRLRRPATRRATARRGSRVRPGASGRGRIQPG